MIAAFKMGLYVQFSITLVLLPRFDSPSQLSYPTGIHAPEYHFATLYAAPCSLPCAASSSRTTATCKTSPPFSSPRPRRLQSRHCRPRRLDVLFRLFDRPWQSHPSVLVTLLCRTSFPSLSIILSLCLGGDASFSCTVVFRSIKINKLDPAQVVFRICRGMQRFLKTTTQC